HRSLAIYGFDAAGTIKTEHVYRNDHEIAAQLAGEKDADAPPAMPTALEVHASQGSDDEAAGAAWIGRFDAAWAGGQATVAPMLDDDVELICNLGSHAKGKKDYTEKAQGFATTFPDQKFSIEHVWTVGDFVIVEHTMHGTHKGGLGRFAPTGKTVAWRFGEVFRLKGGKLIGDWAFGDFTPMAKVLGLP